MSGRSWMAALTLSAGLVVATTRPAPADDKPAPPSPAPAATEVKAPAGTSAPFNTVKLELYIAGLGPKGCDVEVKPAHAACSFPKITQHVGRDGKAMVTVNQVRTENADRDCSFAITIHEPGQPPRTLYRGLRLKPAGTPTPQLLSCYLSSPSRVARIAGQSATESTTKR